MNRPKKSSTHLAACVVALALCLTAPGCGNDLQTVVETKQDTVLVRYKDGTLVQVLNDMRYELAPGQQVKVTENCEGYPHVAVAYAPQ